MSPIWSSPPITVIARTRTVLVLFRVRPAVVEFWLPGLAISLRHTRGAGRVVDSRGNTKIVYTCV